MGKWLAAAALLAAQGNPDVKFDEKLGVSVQKPAKKPEWEFKKTTETRVRGAQIVIAHKSDDLVIEIYASGPPQGYSHDPKRAAEELYKETLANNKDYKDARQLNLDSGALPFGGAGGARAWVLDMVTRDQKDKNHDWKVYCLIGKENQSLYKIAVIAADGVMAKHKKEVDAILATVRTYKLPKK